MEEKIEEKKEERIEEEKEEKIEEEIEEEIKEEIKEEEKEMECTQLEKCSLCDDESASMNLCIKCNNKDGYYFLNNIVYPNNIIGINENYIDCINNNSKPSNFYFNTEKKSYEPCYQTCSTCEIGGDGNENHCTSCEKNYIRNPDFVDTSNCVIKCVFFYYYTTYEQYKCTEKLICPHDYSLFIKGKKKCIDICEKDDTYKYQYNGECLKDCPKNTTKETNSYLCKDKEINKCILSENDFYSLNENLTENEVEIRAKNYAKEFYYNDNHVSLFKNDMYSISLYKNGECISKLALEFPEIDFGECYKKIKDHYHIDDNLVIAIITKKEENNYYKMASYSLYDPVVGNKLLANDICKDENITYNENLINKLDPSKVNIDYILYLTGQNIDVFNLSSPFYTDICFHFKSPINKDISLKDRILLCFPNVTLCEEGCEIKGVNITTLKAICECRFNNLVNTDLYGVGALYKDQLEDIQDMIKQTNIEILKCYKDLLDYHYYKSNIGSFFIIILIIIQIILFAIYLFKGLYLIEKYIFNLTDKYLYNISNNNDKIIQNLLFDTNKKKTIKFNEPSKRKVTKKVKNGASQNNIIRKNKRGKTSEPKNKNKEIEIRRTHKYKKITLNLNSKKSFDNQLFSTNKNLQNYDVITSKEVELSKKILDSKENYKGDLKINLKNDLDVDMKKYLKTDIDDMNYEDAIKSDKRKFCQLFSDNLKTNQIILNTFYYKEPLKPIYIKIILFILNLDLYLFVNALFINEDYISQIYKSKDKDNFFSFFPRSIDRILYATTVRVFLNFIIDCIFIEEKKIKGIFIREKNNELILKYEIIQVIKNIRKIFLYFISITLIIMLFSLYHNLL